MTTKIILPNFVLEFINFFKVKKYQIYLVGGAVRDSLLKRPVKNWDFATNAKPEEILKLFPHGFYNNNYGTVTISVETPNSNLSTNKTFFEITPFRKESNYQDFRHPQKIEWAKTIEEDLGRRDFTINAIAFDGKNLIDPFSGLTDLKNKIIKAVGDPDFRFKEDALRLIRAIRLATELKFLLEENTRKAIKRNSHLIKKIAKERVRDELFKILETDHPAEGIFFLKNTGLLKFIIPLLDQAFSIPQKSPKRHHIYDVGTHSVLSLKFCPSKDVIVRLATLLHDIGKVKTFKKDAKTGLITFFNHEVVGGEEVKKIADDLRLSKKEKDKLYKLVRFHQFSVSEIQSDKAIRRFIRQIGKENIQDILDLRLADRLGSGAKPTSWRFELFKKRLIEVQKEPFKITDLKINGYDVMRLLKIKPGPQVGKILRQIFLEVLEKKLKNERNDLIKRLIEIKDEK